MVITRPKVLPPQISISSPSVNNMETWLVIRWKWIRFKVISNLRFHLKNSRVGSHLPNMECLDHKYLPKVDSFLMTKTWPRFAPSIRHTILHTLENGPITHWMNSSRTRALVQMKIPTTPIIILSMNWLSETFTKVFQISNGTHHASPWRLKEWPLTIMSSLKRFTQATIWPVRRSQLMLLSAYFMEETNCMRKCMVFHERPRRSTSKGEN